MIELSHVTKTYNIGGEKIYALNDVSLKIEKGEFIAIVGPSGSGKSTLANVIGGLDTPDKGTIQVDRQDISKISDNALSRYRNQKIGFIFQTFNLQPIYTALENVMMPMIFAKVPMKERKTRALECLKAVGLEDRIQHKPSQLSGGQRQRVCIARALANRPSIIIADEPTGNLDSKRGEEIIELLKKLNHDSEITLLVITHDSDVAHQAQKILTIKDGKIT